MGCGQSKIHLYPRKSKSKANGKKSGHVDTDADADDDEGHIEEGGEKDINHHDKVNQGDGDELGVNGDGKGSPEANGDITVSLLRGRNNPLLANQEISTSQQNFFRMLDRKIEEGPDYDSNSETEIALEEARMNALVQHWESASITASMCSSASRSLQTTPVRQQYDQPQLVPIRQPATQLARSAVQNSIAQQQHQQVLTNDFLPPPPPPPSAAAVAAAKAAAAAQINQQTSNILILGQHHLQQQNLSIRQQPQTTTFIPAHQMQPGGILMSALQQQQQQQQQPQNNIGNPSPKRTDTRVLMPQNSFHSQQQQLQHQQLQQQQQQQQQQAMQQQLMQQNSPAQTAYVMPNLRPVSQRQTPTTPIIGIGVGVSAAVVSPHMQLAYYSQPQNYYGEVIPHPHMQLTQQQIMTSSTQPSGLPEYRYPPPPMNVMNSQMQRQTMEAAYGTITSAPIGGGYGSPGPPIRATLQSSLHHRQTSRRPTLETQYSQELS
ncbi:hypothetical protein ACFFRR_010904 [Megaselia abdita]